MSRNCFSNCSASVKCFYGSAKSSNGCSASIKNKVSNMKITRDLPRISEIRRIWNY